MHRGTPGITIPRFSADPLGTEAELTDGPDDYNPYEDASRRHNPTRGDDPYAFDDVDPQVPDSAQLSRPEPTIPEPGFQPPAPDFL